MKRNKNGTIGIYKIYHLKGNKKNENILLPYLSIDTTQNKNNIISIVDTLSNLYFLTSNGYIASYSKSSISFIPFNYNTKFIYSISTGDNHIIALDNNYDLWGWGDNTYHQSAPELNQNFIDAPVQIEIKEQLSQVFAVKNSSMVIGNDNTVILWGSVLEHFVNIEIDNTKDEKYESSLVKRNDIQTKINGMKYDSDYSRRIFEQIYYYKTNLNKIIKDNNLLLDQKDEIEDKIYSITDRLKQDEKKNWNSYIDISSDPKTKLINITISETNAKIAKNIKKKEETLKDIITTENEIEELTKEIKRNEDEYTKLSNEEIELNRLKDEATLKKNYKEKEEFLNKLYAITINKDTVNQVTKANSVKVDLKTKHLNSLLKYYEKKKKKFLKLNTSLFTLQDILKLLQYRTAQEQRRIANENNPKEEDESQKETELLKELLDINTRIDSSSYLALNTNYPYQTINEIITQSNILLESIQSKFETFQNNISSTFKEKLKLISDFLHKKISIIIQQNKMILTLETYLSSFNKEVIYANFPNRIKSKDINFHCGNSDIDFYDFSNNIDYIYKEIITEFIKETFNFVEEERFKQDNLIDQKIIQEYIKDKKVYENILYKRKHYCDKKEEYANNWGFISDALIQQGNPKKEGNKYEDVFSYSKDTYSKNEKEESTFNWNFLNFINKNK